MSDRRTTNLYREGVEAATQADRAFQRLRKWVVWLSIVGGFALILAGAAIAISVLNGAHQRGIIREEAEQRTRDTARLAREAEDRAQLAERRAQQAIEVLRGETKTIERGRGPAQPQIEVLEGPRGRQGPMGPRGARGFGPEPIAPLPGKDGKDGKDGRPPTAEEIADAITAYCASRNECRGPTGPDGQPGAAVSPELIAQAVTDYCSTRNECRGADGAQGPPGPPGEAGTTTTIVIICTAPGVPDPRCP